MKFRVYASEPNAAIDDGFSTEHVEDFDGKQYALIMADDLLSQGRVVQIEPVKEGEDG